MLDNFYTRYGKRIFDFLASLAGLLVLSPLFLVIALLIKLQDGGPVFFEHKRIGKDFRPFYIYKFRTMIIDADKMGPPITRGDDPRITPIGRFLRKFKIDELPQLFNVLKGEMSLVGPRPEVHKYIQFFKDDYKEILKVKPGITDYASLKYKNEEKLLKNLDNPERIYLEKILPEKIKYYKKFVREMNFLIDIKLIFKTIGKIFFDVFKTIDL